MVTIAQLLVVVENSSAILIFFLLHSYLYKSQINGYQGCDQILMSTLISNKKLGVYKNMRNTVHINSIFVCVGKRIDCNFRNVPVSGFKKTSSRKIKIANFYLLFRVYLKKTNLPSLTLYDAMYVLTRLTSLEQLSLAEFSGE